MAILALIILFIFVIVSYRYGKNDWLSPWFLLCAMLLLSYIIVLLNYKNWEVIIYPQFIIYICIALFSWLVGSVGYRVFRSCMRESENKIVDKRLDYRLGAYFPFEIIFIISVLMFCLYIYNSLKNFNVFSLLQFQVALRENYEEVKEGNFLKSQIFEIERALAYICTYRLMLQKYFGVKQKKTIMVIIPIILFLLCALVSTDRNVLLRYAIYFMCLYVLFFKDKFRNESRKKTNKKIVRTIFILTLFFGSIFYLYGKAKLYTSNFGRAIGIYAGSGLYNLNLWLHDFDGKYMHGEITFSTLKNSLSVLGICKPSEIPFNMDFISYRSANGYIYASNIYSALKGYIEDFGIIGIIIIPCITGYFYEFLYSFSMKKRHSIRWIVYAMYIYPIIYYPILEQLFKRFHFGLVYEFFWIFFFYYIIWGKHGLWRIKFTIGKRK